MDRFAKEGWAVYGPSDQVKCPSTETVRRDDRRGGPYKAQQMLRGGSPARWAPDEVPPKWERRRLQWPDGQAPSGNGPFQRTCRWVIDESGPETATFVRAVPVDESGEKARFAYLEPIPLGSTISYHVCYKCGVRLEILRVPTALALRAS